MQPLLYHLPSPAFGATGVCSALHSTANPTKYNQKLRVLEMDMHSSPHDEEVDRKTFDKAPEPASPSYPGTLPEPSSTEKFHRGRACAGPRSAPLHRGRAWIGIPARRRHRSALQLSQRREDERKRRRELGQLGVRWDFVTCEAGLLRFCSRPSKRMIPDCLHPMPVQRRSCTTQTDAGG